VKRSKQLARLAPLPRSGALRRVALLAAAKRRRRTGFDRRTIAVILDRDGHACASCGSVGNVVAHHRRNRGMGGSTDAETNSVRNGLALCWACNGLAEHHAHYAQEARERGIKLRHGDPLTTPVRYADGVLWLLRMDGTRQRVDEEAA